VTSPIRVLRQIIAPNGKRRTRRALLLPDEPIALATEPVPYVVLDESQLEQLLDSGDVLANEFDTCPAEQRTTFHALYRNGLRKCWTCGVETVGGAE
jgi:hypothetical protein